MSAEELEEHRRYITDDVKIAAYREALATVVTSESVVVDLGAGTGLLGLLAAECGAKRVYAIDSGNILRLATEAAQSRFGDRIVHVRGASTEVVLPEMADVVVCDQIGGFVHEAGILRYFSDARARLLRPGGVLIPGSFELSLTPVGNEHVERIVADWDRPAAHGFDLRVFGDAAANSEFRIRAGSEARLGSSEAVARLESHEHKPYGGEVTLTIERAGRFSGLLGTFVAHLVPGVTITNAPWAARPFSRWQNFYPVRTPVEVAPGDRIEASILVAPKNGVVSWSATVIRDDAAPVSFRHDTLNGQFDGPSAIIRSSDAWTPVLGERAEAARRVLELADGRRSVGAIAERLCAEFPHLFPSFEPAKGFAQRVLGPALEPGS